MAADPPKSSLKPFPGYRERICYYADRPCSPGYNVIHNVVFTHIKEIQRRVKHLHWFLHCKMVTSGDEFCTISPSRDQKVILLKAIRCLAPMEQWLAIFDQVSLLLLCLHAVIALLYIYILSII